MSIPMLSDPAEVETSSMMGARVDSRCLTRRSTAHTRRPRVLVVDNQRETIATISALLEGEGFEVEVVTDGDLALQWLAEQKPDAALIEWMVAEVSGLELCRRIRQNHDLRDLPIIMLTRRGSDDDRVRGLELGADDYIVKPFNSRELIARLRGVLRRCYPQRHLELLRYHDIEMDTAMCRVTRGGLLIHLGPKEYRLLRVLLEAPRRAFTRQQLIDAVSGYNSFLDERTIDVFVRRLRIALGSAAGKGPLRTVRGVGYALELTCPR